MGRWLLVFQLLLIWVAAAAAAVPIALPDCRDTCGGVKVPYPFGIGDACSIDVPFNLTCNETFYPPKLFLGGFEVLDISLEGQARVNSYTASDCYNEKHRFLSFWSSMAFPNDWPFSFSSTHNKFTALGCDTLAYITGKLRGPNRRFTSGCVSFCSDKESVVNGTCSGIGCCQTSIPANAKAFTLIVNSTNNHTGLLDFNPCSYAFLIDQERFQFNKDDLSINDTYGPGKGIKAPVVVDWMIGNETCESVDKSSDAYACKSANSTCDDPANGPGYRCNCSLGFEGNPYLKGGCTDVDECSSENMPKFCFGGICHNMEGDFTCSCPKGSHHDGISRCIPKSVPTRDVTKIILSTVLSFLFVLIVGSWAYWGLQKRKLIKLKQKFFQENGGLLLQQRITSNEGKATIFTTQELERATNKFDESRIIGRGGFGMVYKGILPDHRIVAIKKSKIADESQIEQFVNEIFILSQINHRNIVKLLGCCLETQVPLLVYEFISNGTLFHHIHDEAQSSSLSLENRLRIASEIVGALAYLHSATSVPIFHRDVKSANILLDANLTAKVSDFGASRLVPLDKNQVTTLVQGTFGYLDPEYFHTGQLTEKSDVYSFGVVLVELLTGEKPICSSRSEEERSLPMFFTSAIRENRLFQVVDDRIVGETDAGQLVAVAQLAVRCLSIKGEERPTMREVASELDGLRKILEHPWAQRNCEETHILLEEHSKGNDGSGIAVRTECHH